MAVSQDGISPSKVKEEEKSRDKRSNIFFGLLFLLLLIGGISLIILGMDFIAISPLMDISNAIIEGMAMILSGFIFAFISVIFILPMRIKEGKVREKRFSLKQKKEGKNIEKFSEEVDLKIYTLLFFLLGLSFIILGVVDLYTSPEGNLFKNLPYSTAKIIFGGILWGVTGFFCWIQNRRAGILVSILLGACLLVIGIEEILTSPPPNPYYGPNRYTPYATPKLIMGIILWGNMLFFCWKTLKEKRIEKEKKSRVFVHGQPYYPMR